MKKKEVEAIKKLKSKSNVMVYYKELKEIPSDIEIDYSPNQDKTILCTKISDREDGLSFRVIMTKGTKWEKHHHDCSETLIVWKGCLQGNLNDIIISRGGIMEMNPNTVHEISALEDSIFYVEFKNPHIKNVTMVSR